MLKLELLPPEILAMISVLDPGIYKLWPTLSLTLAVSSRFNGHLNKQGWFKKLPFTRGEETRFEDGKPSIERKWHKNGQLYKEIHYKYFKRHGIHKGWHMNGQRQWLCTFVDGKKEGKYEGWHSNGNPSWLCAYKRGKLVGEYISWFPNGKMHVRCFYDCGDLHGTFSTWKSNGELTKKEEYDQGRVIVEK